MCVAYPYASKVGGQLSGLLRGNVHVAHQVRGHTPWGALMAFRHEFELVKAVRIATC